MNALDRSLIEKAGYDNGFEIIQKSDPSVVSLCLSLHPVKVDITIGNHEGAYALRFSDTLSLPGLKRGLNNELFQNGKIEAWYCVAGRSDTSSRGEGRVKAGIFIYLCCISSFVISNGNIYLYRMKR